MMWSRLALASAAALIGTLAAVAADAADVVLYDQPGGVGERPAWSSFHEAAFNTGFRTYDNFSLSTNGVITSVEWQGLYIDFVTHSNNPAAPTTTSWTLGFFADSATGPGAQLYSVNLPVASVTSTFVGDSVWVFSPGDESTVPNYRFHADLPTAFLAAMGTQYWFSALSEQPQSQPQFAWTNSTAGDLRTVLDVLGGARFEVTADRNLQLIGQIPEPATLAILGLGLLGLGVVRRR